MKTAAEELRESMGGITNEAAEELKYRAGEVKAFAKEMSPLDGSEAWYFIRIEVGRSYSIPLHPEHHEIIAKMKDGDTVSMKVETGKTFSVTRSGNTVTFTPPGITSSKTATVPRSLFT